MSKKKQKATTRSPQGRSSGRVARRRLGWLIAGTLVLAVLVGAWIVSRERQASAPAVRLPGPAGGRDVAQDVNTHVGERAPSFSLSTADGRTHAVNPGGGRPTVLIFHMGIG